MPFPHRFLLVSNAPHSHAFPSRYIATGIVQRAIMSISRRPINVTYINANNTTNISCCNIFKDWIEKIFQLFLFAMLSIDWETMLKDSLRFFFELSERRRRCSSFSFELIYSRLLKGIKGTTFEKPFRFNIGDISFGGMIVSKGGNGGRLPPSIHYFSFLSLHYSASPSILYRDFQRN